jgi:hypothetical protein
LKKSIFVLLMVSLITLTLIPAACSRSTSLNGYSTASVRGVSFSYPSDWQDLSSTMAFMNTDYSSLKCWMDPSTSTMLLIMIADMDQVPNADMPAVLTTEKKKELIDYYNGLSGSADEPTITNELETSIGGEWAWQQQFTSHMGEKPQLATTPAFSITTNCSAFTMRH